MFFNFELWRLILGIRVQVRISFDRFGLFGKFVELAF